MRAFERHVRTRRKWVFANEDDLPGCVVVVAFVEVEFVVVVATNHTKDSDVLQASISQQKQQKCSCKLTQQKPCNGSRKQRNQLPADRRVSVDGTTLGKPFAVCLGLSVEVDLDFHVDLYVTCPEWSTVPTVNWS